MRYSSNKLFTNEFMMVDLVDFVEIECLSI